MILLPSRRAQYYARLTGIAIEAFQSGASCICVSNTWVEDCMNEIGGGYAIENESVVDLVSAIRKLADSGKSGLDNERVIQARSRYSPEAFVEQLFGGRDST